MRKSFFETLKDNISTIITLVIILTLVFASYVVLGIQTEFSQDFVAKLVMMFVIQVLMIFLWMPEGKKKGELNDEYKGIKDTANKSMAKATEQYDDLDKFCKVATAENRRAYIRQKLARKGIQYDFKDEPSYKLTEQDRKEIDKTERASLVRVSEIKATELTANTKISLVYDIRNHETRAESTSTVFKLATSIVTSFLGAMLTFGTKEFSWATTTRLLYYIAVMITTIAMAYKTGIDLVTVSRKDYFVRVVDFLQRFEDWKKKQG